MASDIVITPSRGSTTVNAKIDFTGASTASSQIRLEVLPDNSLAFIGTTGSLFSVADSVTGSLMSVNDASGLPILEVFDTDKVVMGQYNQNTLVVNGTNVGIGTASPTSKLEIRGGTANQTNDATVYITADNDNDWALVVDKNRSLATEYGLRIITGSAASYALAVYGGGSLSARIAGNGDIYAPRMIDSTSTGYYVDPGSTSNLYGLTVAATITGNAATASSAAAITGGMPNGTDYYINLRVIRNNNTSVSNDGMYIGYGNSNSGITRLYGGGSTNNHAYVDVNGDIWRSSGGYQYVYNSGTWSGISIGGNAATVTNGVYTTGNQSLSGRVTLTNGGVGGNGTLTVSGDITTYRSANSGVIYFGSDQSHYLFFDGSNYYLPSGNLYVVNGTNLVLHSGNYNSYAPTLTGTGASGTWGISITGNAATATSADQIDGVAFRNTGSNAGTAADSLDQNGITYVNSNISLLNQTDGALYSQAYNSNWQHQIYGDYRTGQIVVRGKNNGTWQAWRTVLDSTNYTSYTGHIGNGTLTLNVSGTGLSGSASFTANQSGATTFTVTSNATSANTASAIVARDASGNFSAGTITATLSGSASALATGNNYQVNSLGVNTAASGTAGEIRATNNITAYYSDERLKTRLGAIENPIEKVKSLSGFYFSPNDTAMALGYKKTIDVGVSAQEVNAILPEIIAPAPIDEKYMTVRYEKLIPLLIEAIKDQQKQIEELRSLLNK